MIYVPIVPTVVAPPQPPSPRTRELAGLLGKVLEEYKKAHPSTTQTEIRAAIRLAATSAAPGGRAAVALALTAVIGGVVAMMVLGIFLSQGGGGGDSGSMSQYPVVAITVAVLGVVLLGVFLFKLRSR